MASDRRTNGIFSDVMRFKAIYDRKCFQPLEINTKGS